MKHLRSLIGVALSLWVMAVGVEGAWAQTYGPANAPGISGTFTPGDIIVGGPGTTQIQDGGQKLNPTPTQIQTGIINALGAVTSGGSLYSNGTFTGVPLTGSISGSGATGNIVVSGGVVTAAYILLGGQNYLSTDILSCNPATCLGGGGSGFTVAVGSLVTPTGRTLPNVEGWVFNVDNFGARGDDGGDDGPAFNQACSLARQLRYGIVTGTAGKTYQIQTSINCTNLNGATTGSPYAIVVDFSQIHMDCQTGSYPCVDGLDGKRVEWRGMQASGNCIANEPTIGLQIGRSAAAQTASQNDIGALKLTGCFSQFALYNAAAEVTHMQGGTIINQDGYNVGVDCINFWGVKSLYVPITWTQNTLASCNSITFHDTTQQNSNPAGKPAMWLGAPGGFKYDGGGYISTLAANAIIIYANDSVLKTTDMTLNVHMEPSPNLQSAILLAGTANPTIFGLHYEEFAAESAFSHIGVDWSGTYGTALTNYTIHNLEEKIMGVASSVTATFTDFGAYQSVTAATTTGGTVGSGCTPGGQTFTATGGDGAQATFTATVTGGGTVTAGAVTVATGGTYQAVPTSPATVTGGGCAVAPTFALTFGATASPPGAVDGQRQALSNAYFASIGNTSGGLYSRSPNGEHNFAGTMTVPSGTITSTATTINPAGLASAPALAFTQYENNTGFYVTGAGAMGWTVGGAVRIDWGISTAGRATVNGSLTITGGGGFTLSNNTASMSFRNGATLISSPNSAVTQLGAADSVTAAVGQTFQMQNIASGGTNNIAGQPFKLIGSLGTGSASSGSIAFQVGKTAASGNTQQTAFNLLALNPGTATTATVQFGDGTNYTTYDSCTALTTGATGILSCTASAAQFKNILEDETVTPFMATRGLNSLRPGAPVWEYRDEFKRFGEGLRVGLIADDVAAM